MLAAALATLSNIRLGVSPGNRYPEDKVCVPSSESQSGAIKSIIEFFAVFVFHTRVRSKVRKFTPLKS